ncbi:MAG: GT-D fold domain-containing glycosyltransferase [Bacillota bacterium]
MKKPENLYEKNLLKPITVLNLIDRAVADKKGFSLARFGIGEISYLSWPENTWLVQDFKRYEKYAGVFSSYQKIKVELATALDKADVVGVITPSRLEFWAKQTKTVFQQLNFTPSTCCCAWIFQDYLKQTDIWPWLRKKKVILIGRRVKEASTIFHREGVQVVDTVAINSDIEIENVVSIVSAIDDWEVALISAGIPATILAPKIANATQKVAIDFGHSLDMLIDGEQFDHAKTVLEWKKNNIRK